MVRFCHGLALCINVLSACHYPITACHYLVTGCHVLSCRFNLTEQCLQYFTQGKDRRLGHVALAEVGSRLPPCFRLIRLKFIIILTTANYS